jgi:protein-tyrosine phosphatase
MFIIFIFRNVASPIELVEDGFLDPNSNYTAFVEVIVPNNEAGRSPYMVPRKPGEAVFHNRNLNSNNNSAVNSVLIGVLGVLAGLVTVALFLLLALVFLRRYSKQVAAAQGGPGAEMDLRRSFRHFVATLRGGRDHSQYLITPNGEPNGVKNSNGGHGPGNNANAAKKLADLPPMKPEDLVPAYLERHKDSDYGFQSEFELLPDGYPDRTTRYCNMKIYIYICILFIS